MPDGIATRDACLFLSWSEGCLHFSRDSSQAVVGGGVEAARGRAVFLAVPPPLSLW